MNSDISEVTLRFLIPKDIDEVSHVQFTLIDLL